jgi:type II secretory ATPase GspE/PulE/Tfp pilus assembly ATPase PilB-like protein
MGLNLVLAAAQVPGGGYVSIVKVVPALLILLVWARLLTWADKDAVAAHLPRTSLNIGMMTGLVIAYAAFFLIPFYFIGLLVLLLIAGGEGAVYAHMRNQEVGLKDLRRQFDNWLKGMGPKKKVVTVAGAVTLVKGGQPVPAPEPETELRVGYDAAQLALTDPLKKKSDQIDIDARGESGSIKYLVDGVSYNGPSVDKAASSSAIGYLKDLAGLDVSDHRKPQTGTMKFTIDGEKFDARVQTAGSTAGEYMRLLINPKNRHNFQLAQLGFTEAQLLTIKKGIDENQGVALLSTPKRMGLTSLMYGIIRGHDAFLKHIQTVERDPEEDLEGITQNKLPANAPAADEYKMVDWVISQEPDSILLNKVEDPRSAVALINYAKTGKRIYVGLRASSSFEALNQWRKLVGDDNLAVEALSIVVNGRVIRKLCMACKIAYAPDPTTLRKLGMNPEKVTQLYQARTEPLRDPKGNPIPCDFCGDLHYKGRTGVFEIMTIDNDMRQAVAAGKPVEPIFRKQRSRFLQEEALGLVEQGETSVQEVKRVLKADAGASAPAAPAAPRRSSAPSPARK